MQICNSILTFQYLTIRYRIKNIKKLKHFIWAERSRESNAYVHASFYYGLETRIFRYAQFTFCLFYCEDTEDVDR